MAIALRAQGTWAATTANLTVTIPTSPSAPQAGDLMIMFYGTKPYNDVPTIDQGWLDGGAATDGTVAAGNDVGSMQARIFYKIHTGTESNPTVTNSTNNVSAAAILVFSKDSSATWDLAFGGGGDATANIAFTFSTPAINSVTGDVIAVFGCERTDAVGSIASQTIGTAAGSCSAFTKAPATDLSTTSGGDMTAFGGYVTRTPNFVGSNPAVIT